MAADLDALAEPVLSTLPTREQTARALRGRMRRFALVQVLDVAVLLACPWPSVQVATAVAFALYRTRTIWTIVHERVHQPPLPITPSLLFYDFCTGWVAWWWRRHHLTHHARTNTPDDPDLGLFFGRGRVTILQYPLLFPLFFYRSLRSHRGPVWPFLVGLGAYAALLAWLLPPWEARLNTAANLGLGTLYVVFTFAPTHPPGVHDAARSGERAVDQLMGSRDVWPTSDLWSWLCGGINRHVEHHLFPHVPHEHLGALVPVVRGWAEARGLRYPSSSPWALWASHLRQVTRLEA